MLPKDTVRMKALLGRFASAYDPVASNTFRAGIFCALIITGINMDIQAQPSVTWQTPVTISGTSDVNTSGFYFGSWAPYDESATNYPVNGVTFQGASDLPGFTSGPTFDNGYNGFGSPNTSDNNYNTLLQSATFSNEGIRPATFSWSGMTPGHTYLVQMWVNDGRNIGESRSETITGENSTSLPLNYGSDGTGPGQYVIGTFVANSSGMQTLILTAFSTGPNPDPQVKPVSGSRPYEQALIANNYRHCCQWGDADIDGNQWAGKWLVCIIENFGCDTCIAAVGTCFDQFL